MELFDNIFREIKSYRKILQVALYLINEKRYDACKTMIEIFLTEEELKEPIDQVLDNSKLFNIKDESCASN